MTEDDWVTVAMADDALVVQLLLQLHQAPLPPSLNKGSSPALRLDWSVKQRRSKQVPRKKADATRASPTTPLSWSGGTSVSGCVADGLEESKPIDTARSKVAVASETPTTKRSRKKKTLPELKELESLLLKERRNLKNQLETLRVSMEKQRAANESLKRLKVDLMSRQITSDAVKTDEIDIAKQIKALCDPTSIMKLSPARNKQELCSPDASFQKQEVGRESSFVLPDLNLPVEDNLGSDILNGFS